MSAGLDLSVPLLVQLSATVPGKAAKQDQCTCIPATHVGNLDGISGFWLQPAQSQPLQLLGGWANGKIYFSLSFLLLNSAFPISTFKSLFWCKKCFWNLCILLQHALSINSLKIPVYSKIMGGLF